jgi:SagB-type dehydrogenase family enzyme
MILLVDPTRGRATPAWCVIAGLLVAATVIGCEGSVKATPAPPGTASATPTLAAIPTATPAPTPMPTSSPEPTWTPLPGSVLQLTPPRLDSEVSLESALHERRSIRDFTSKALTFEEISQLLWAAQGVTSSNGGRTAPSAGALYPLEVYVVTKQYVLHYLPAHHQAEVHLSGDRRAVLEAAALSQSAVGDAPAVFVITGVFERTQAKYGSRASRYVYLEAGHAAQNLLLEAVALGLGGVPMGAFTDAAVTRALSLPADHAPLYLIPIGHPA